MATNYKQDGDRLTLTAPSGGVTSGTLYAIGDLVVVALGAADEGDDFVGCRSGVWEFDKKAALALSAGDVAFWATDDLEISDDPTDTFVGVVVEDAAGADTTVKVLLTPSLIPSIAGTVATAPNHNFAATAAPGVGDDSAADYSVGSMWFDVTNDVIYACVDATEGAAVWKQISNAA